MLVRLSHSTYQTELILFLRNSGVSRVERSGADVRVDGVGKNALIRILDTWRSLHSDVRTEVIADEA